LKKLKNYEGGQYGQRWAAKICTVQDPLTASVAPFADDLYYYGLSDIEGSHEIQTLIAIDPNTNALYEWENGVFTLKDEEDLSDIDEPFIIPLDGETAAAVATWINQQPEENPFGFNVYDHNPEERNLFEMAAPELDYEELGRVASIIATGRRVAKPIIPSQGYTPAERSANVAKQPRAPGGKFGSGKQPTGTQLTAYAKAHLANTPGVGALVTSIRNLINAWLLGTGVFAKAPRKPVKPRGPRTAQQKAHTSQVKAANKAARLKAASGGSISSLIAAASGEAPTEPLTDAPVDPLYLAVVDDVDKNSVLDVIAIRTNDEGEPEAWVRRKGTWENDPDYLAKIEGQSPPALRQIEDEDAVKVVLQQVDDHDGAKAAPVADDTSTSDQISSLAVGFSLPDGSYPIYSVEQLSNAVDTMQSYEPDSFELAHVRKRAQALNRMDILPKEWRSATFLEKGIVASASSVLYGEYGEIVAAGHKGNGGAERLKAYWAFGKGAAKVRWGTPGDLTRCHRHLAKYVGDSEAWGLSQNIHEMVFGVSNIVHDRSYWSIRLSW